MPLTAPLRLSEATRRQLRCPVCRSELELSDSRLTCVNPSCNTVFPVIDGVPVLINESSSVFSIADFVSKRSTFFKPASPIKGALAKSLPSMGHNLRAKTNYKQFADMLLAGKDRPRVLAVGASIVGEGLDIILDTGAIELIETDIAFGPRTSLICDAHDIPFEDGGFDGIITQAVLEHVVDPYRCVSEIHRVLKDGGLVYGEIPFMQQVHGGGIDFTRFTHLGLRRLFRSFEELCSGAAAGPGMALAWSCEYLLLSFVVSKNARSVMKLVSRLGFSWLKYLDYYLMDKPGTLDAASGYYFIGRKSDHAVPDRELIKLYRGGQ